MFSTVWNTQRFTEFSREEKGRKETEDTWWRKRRVQRRREIEVTRMR